MPKAFTTDKMKHKTRDAWAGRLFVLPSFLLILVFSAVPMVLTALLSFTSYNVIQQPAWIGLRNYAYLLSDPFVAASVKNTLLFALVVVPLQTMLALLIAEVLHAKFPGRFSRFVRGSLFVPVISSTILVGTVWSILLMTDGGIVNMLLGGLRIPKVNWLGTTQTALVSIALITVWKNIGYFLVIYYAGILNIPVSLYEAASVDGAGAWYRFRHITVPLLRPVTVLVVTLGTIWSFQAFDLVYTMTGGGPGRSTVTLVLTIYRSAFKELSMGYASAVSVLFLSLIMLITMLQRLFYGQDKEGRP